MLQPNEMKNKQTWVGACSHSITGQACMLRGEGRVQFFFSHQVQFWAGIKIYSCGQALRNFMCLGSAIHTYAALQFNCNLSPKRNTTLKDNNYFIYIYIY